jgi:hypothetical protein
MYWGNGHNGHLNARSVDTYWESATDGEVCAVTVLPYQNVFGAD